MTDHKDGDPTYPDERYAMSKQVDRIVDILRFCCDVAPMTCEQAREALAATIEKALGSPNDAGSE